MAPSSLHPQHCPAAASSLEMLAVSRLGTGGLCCPALITAVGLLGGKGIAGADCQTWGSRGRALETE